MKQTKAKTRILLITCALTALIIFALAGCVSVPKKQLKSSDIPTGEGTEYAAFLKAPGTGTRQVKLDLEGPWDFTGNTDDPVVKSRIVGTDKAAEHNEYPEAGYAEEVIKSEFTSGATAFNFIKITDKTLFVYGQSVAPDDSEPRHKKYLKPERLLVFPVRVGDSWEDTVELLGEDAQKLKITRTVVAKGEVKVPAGVFFDCFMVRVEKTPVDQDGAASRIFMYTWWAPGVGLVAAVSSEPGEQDKMFSEADYIFRLKSFKIRD